MLKWDISLWYFFKNYTEKDIKMVKNVTGLKILVILSFLAVFAGCGNKEDEVQTLKQELAKTREELRICQRNFEAVSLDLKNSKASQRNLGTQLGSVDDVSKTLEERLQFYNQQITIFQTQIQQLNTTITEQESIITEQEAIIADQEAALLELTGGVTEQTPYY